MTASLSHINERGEANMVDVSGKAATCKHRCNSRPVKRRHWASAPD